ncbi:MAG: Ig-like domain-containing protein [Methanobacterium formicicum]
MRSIANIKIIIVFFVCLCLFLVMGCVSAAVLVVNSSVGVQGALNNDSSFDMVKTENMDTYEGIGLVDQGVQASMELDTVAPVAVSCDPGYNAVNVESNKTITIEFNENISRGTGLIELKNSNEALIPVTVSINGNVLIITPVNLLTEDKYTLICHEGSVTDLAGNPVEEGTTYFTTGTSPIVTNVTPSVGETNVALNKNITITFNEPVKAGNLWFDLCYTNNGTNIQVPVNISINGNILTITPLSQLTENRYTLVGQEGGVTDLAGNPMPAGMMDFITGSSPIVTNVSPSVGETNVTLNRNITITFNEPVKAGSLWFELYCVNNGDYVLVPVNTSISENVVTIIPSNLLAGCRHILVGHEACVTDLAGNPVQSGMMEFTTVSDLIAPTVTANLASGVYNTTKIVTLTAIDNLDPNPSIYYTTNGSTPTTSSTRYTNPINITSSTILKFMAVDNAGNQGPVNTEQYIIGLVKNINTGRSYSSIQAAINDPLTLNGHTIEVSLGTFTENIIVNKSLTIKAVSEGNVTLFALNSSQPIFTITSSGNGSSIQGFTLMETETSENTKGIHLQSANNCSIIGNIIQGNYYGISIYASDNTLIHNNTINGSSYTAIGISESSNSKIEENQLLNAVIGVNIVNSNDNQLLTNILKQIQFCAIYLSLSSRNIIADNVILQNTYGIQAHNSINNTILYNNISYNRADGINFGGMNCGSNNNIFLGNYISHNSYNGVKFSDSYNNSIYENDISNNRYSGITFYSSSASVNFNRIIGNNIYGLETNGNSTINANNNWWGTNNLTVSSNNSSDIHIADGFVDHELWLMLNLTGSTIHVTQNSNSSSEITADLTHNNQGEDTSGSGAIPDGLPVNFTTTLGNITATTTTRKGRATVNLISNSSSEATTVFARVDNETISKEFRKSFSTIHAAANDPLTMDGDIILVENGTYLENIELNKSLFIISEGNVTVHAANPSLSVFTINTGGNGSVIYGFTIIGANQANQYSEILSPSGILLKSTNNCTIENNTLENNCYGVYVLDSSYNQVKSNIITNNERGILVPAWCDSFDEYFSSTYDIPELYEYALLEYEEYYFGTHSISFYNYITENLIMNNTNGIFIESDYYSSSSGSEDTHVLENNVINNYIGIYTYATNAHIHFNRITGNNKTGLFMKGGYVNVINNWWGSNNPVIGTDLSMNADVFYVETTSEQPTIPTWWIRENFTPYLVLNISPTSYKVSNGKICESTITADLTHNSNGEETTSKGFVPDGIPVEFSTDNDGTITNRSYIEDGKASATLVLNPNLQSGMTNVTAMVDVQGASTLVDRIAKIIITIKSTAIDISTNNPLEFSYEMPLNDSVTQISVLWKEYTNVTDPFKNELDIIINGDIVQSNVFTNAAYLYVKDYYSGIYGFTFFEAIGNINRFLSNVGDINSEEVQLFMSIYQSMLTSQDFDFIMNNRLLFTDIINITVSYPGDSSKFISVNPGNSSDITLKFGGTPIQRMSTILYRNGGYRHCLGDPYDPNATYEYREAGYEGVRSFAIVTTRVTAETLQYWLDKKSLYQAGPMKAAYGTFLTSLLMIKCHDIVADNAAAEFNVTWSRTTPIVVSVVDDAYEGYMTLECDHRFGMDVTGDSSNVRAFRFACSMAISPIEYGVMQTLFPCLNSSSEGNFSLSPTSSVTIGWGHEILNGEMPDIFMSNGYLVIKSIDNHLFLVIDPETGIVRDVMATTSTFSYATWCYSDQQTDWSSDLGEEIISNNQTVSLEDIKPTWLGFIITAGTGAATETGTMGVTGLSLGTLELGAAGTVIAYGGAVVGMSVAVAVLLYEPYFMLYEFPEKLRIMKEIYDMKQNQSEAWTGAVSLFLPKDREPTPKELQEAYIKAASLLMDMYESGDMDYYYRAYSYLTAIGRSYKSDHQTTLDMYVDEWFQKYIIDEQLGVGGSSGGNSTEWADAFLNTARFIKDQGTKMVNGIQAGDPVAVAEGAGGVTLGIGIMDLLTSGLIHNIILEKYNAYMKFESILGIGKGSGGGGGSVIP